MFTDWWISWVTKSLSEPGMQPYFLWHYFQAVNPSLPCFSFQFINKEWKTHDLRVVMVLELIEVLGLRHFRRTSEQQWEMMTHPNREPSLDKLLRQTGVWGFMKTACVLRRNGCSWQGVKMMSVLSHAAAEVLAIAACPQVGCLQMTGL